MRARVLVVDDSAFMRKAISRMLAADPGIDVVGTADGGEGCLKLARELEPDVVTLDIVMPGMDGIAVLRELMRTCPVPVLMVSKLTAENAEIGLSALEAGAVDIVDKPTVYTHMNMFTISEELVAKVKAAAGVETARLARIADAPPAARPGSSQSAAKHPALAANDLDVVVIGASTGGPPALQRIVSAIPVGFPLPVVIVQHMPPGFTAALAQRLDTLCAVEVKEAAEGDLVAPGRILLAPAGSHLHFERRKGAVTVRLDHSPAGTAHEPSVDVAMASAASVYGGRAVGVLLTGMGSDGADGLTAIRRAGGHTIAESESSAVIYGMPKAAVERGGAVSVADLEEIACVIARIGA